MLKIVSFNLRCVWDGDDVNCFLNRAAGILQKISEEKPDVIGFQEVLPHVALWLKENLKDYYVVGCPRCDDLTGEQVAIAFKPDKFNLMKMDTFWLSPTPYAPGSRYPEQSICPRTCTEVVLQELSSGKILRMMNTHLDHEGSLARMLGAGQILETMDAAHFFPDAPIILVGDMNAEPDSPEMQLIASRMQNLTEGIGITYHGYMGANQCSIDYIFIKGAITGTDVKKWEDTRDGLYLSDHFPISAELTLL